jgi:4-amino-4-deoxy-L-arabinose transferase-like glycosyltransferase
MNFVYVFIKKNNEKFLTDILVLSLLFGLVFFQTLGKFPLMDPDEGRYAEIPREMVESGDYVTPHLDYAKFFFKPPLLYWMNAVSFNVFGESELTARLPSALCGLLIILFTYCFGRHIFGRRGAFLSALILGTSGGFFVCARLVLVDTPLTLCMMGTLYSFMIASRKDEKHRGFYFHAFYAFMALTVLAKGLIGVFLPAMIILFYMLLTKRWSLIKEMRLLSGVPLFLIIAAPWFILVSIRNPEFFRFFFIREHFERYLSTVHGRHEPMWFLIPIFFGMMFPWTCFFPAVVLRLWHERKSENADIRLFLLLWVICIFVFFSSSESILVTYILPIFPPAAVLTGLTFSTLFEKRDKPLKLQAYTASVILCAGGVGGILYPHLIRVSGVYPVGFTIIGIIVFTGGLLAFRNTVHKNTVGLFYALCITLYLTEMLGSAMIPSIFIEQRSSKKLALIAKEMAGPDTLIASYLYEPSLAFYTKRKFVMIDASKNIDLEFGSKQNGEPDLLFDIEQFLRLWDSDKHIIALMNESDAIWLNDKVASPVITLGRQGKKHLTTNRWHINAPH